jgi:phytoene dehydrogenase-like protein
VGTRARTYDAVVVGSGPNGLAAAIRLALAGKRVLVREAAATVGGGARTEELTLPGFRHDVCSGFHPLTAASPFLRRLPLAEHGLEWVRAEAELAHPLPDGTAVLLRRSLTETAAGLGPDGGAYRRLVAPLVRDWSLLERVIFGSLLRAPRHPVAAARFGLDALRSADGLARSRFCSEPARALLAGCSAHSTLPLERPPTAAFGLVLLTLGHVAGWPFPRGGAQAISDALASYLRFLGGELETEAPVESLDDLPPARAVLADVAPRELVRLAGDLFPRCYRRGLERYRYGPGAFKLDLALDGPIPWSAPEVARAGCVHVGGPLEAIAASERAAWEGRPPEEPFVIVGQHSLFDPTRAPDGKHTVWAYAHVPHGWDGDETEAIEAQIERFAPGFRDRILARHALSPPDSELRNPNLVGGDVSAGAQDLRGIVARPVLRLVPWSTPVPGLFLCSASTPPGGGVHGLCGYWAAEAALRGALAR